MRLKPESIAAPHTPLTGIILTAWSSLVALGLLACGQALAAPSGGNIVAGSGAISQQQNTTLVQQQSQALSIDWQSFNIAQGEHVQFQQPNQNAAALNRILDQNPSQIFGSLSANGKVFLINPNGMVFGPGSQVNVGALMASTLDITPADFQSGRYELWSTGRGGSILNQGSLTAAEGGSVSLLGERVRNEGLVIANYGQINLASGRHAVLNFDGNHLLNFSVDGAVLNEALPSDALVENSGSLLAAGGSVVLSGQAANEALTRVVNNQGVIRATRIDNSGGVVRLLGAGGITLNSGNIDVTGGDAISTGGSVEISGDRVGILGSAVIDASGTAGGGSIRIGKTLATTDDEPRAQFTQLGPETRLLANGGTTGDGGEIVAWADDTVWAYGSLEARGGSKAGNGGFIDISGVGGIVFDGSVDLGASAGTVGTLLFDPTDIVIHDQGDGAQANDGLLPDLSDLTVGAGSFNIGELALEGLGSSATVILEATNNITINNLADDQLTFATSSSGSITMTADLDNNGSGAFSMDTSDTITTQGGAVTISGNSVTVGAIKTDIAGLSDGAISLAATGSLSVAGNLNAGSQSISLAVDTDNNGVETLSLGGTLAGTGGISLQGGTDGSETLVGPNTPNTWDITALGVGTLNGSAFTNFTNLTGGSGDDSFVVSGIGKIAGTIDGGSQASADNVDYSASSSLVSVSLGVDVVNIETLVGGGADFTLATDNVPNTWIITGQDDGTVAGVSFTDFSNLIGGNDTDSFTLNGGSITGTIDGGAGSDTLTAGNTANNWNILSADGGNVDGVFGFTNIENLTGGSGSDTFILNAGSISGTINGGAGTDSLAPDNVANTWNISGADAGSVTGVGAFSNMENLNGRNDTDSFTFAAGASVSGSIDGGGGSDSVDLSALAGSVVVDLSSGDYANIELFTGNNTDSTLIGGNGSNIWVINGDYDSLNDGLLGSIGFINFNNLTGGSGVDTFTFNGGVIDGLVDGGSGSDTIVADNAGNTWSITTTDGGTLNALSFSAIENLTGNAASDNFVFTNGSNISGAVNGAGGNDTVDYSGESGAVSVDIGFSGFSNIESFIGNNTNSTLIGGSSQNTWVITGQNDGLIGTTAFTDFNNLTGNSNVDSFTLSGGSITGTIDGGGGSDTIVADNVANTWNITGADSGNVTGIANFTNVENLTGNGNTDNFVFANGASLSGIADGAAGNDTVDYSSVLGLVNVSLDAGTFANIETIIGNGSNSTLTGANTATTWTLSGADGGLVNSLNFVAFANLVGNAAADTFIISGGSISGSIDGGGGSDSLSGENVDTTWNITGADTGSLASIGSFSGIEWLQGGSGVDSFQFANGASFSGTIDGGAGNDGVDTSAQVGAVVIDLSSGNIANVENFTGNNSDSTFISDDTNHTWTITGSNSGTVGSLSISGFNKLVGGQGSDSFVLSGGAITGSIDGGAGVNSLTADNTNNTWNISATNAGSVTGVAAFSNIANLSGNSQIDNFVFENLGSVSGSVNGAAGTDSVDLAAKAGSVAITLGSSGYSNIETFIGNNIDSTLTGPNSSNTWSITGVNDGMVGSVAFFNFNNLTGNSSSDNFIFSDGSSISGSVDAGAGLDKVDFSAVSGAVDVQLGAAGFTNVETFIGNDTASTLTADNTANNWVISGVNAGSVGSINFSGFNYLTGNNGVDSFVLNGGSVTGAIDGAGASDSLTADSGANNWTISGANAGSVTSVAAFTAIENLQGSSSSDNFVFADGGQISGTVDGMSGSDTVDQSAQSGAVTISLGATGYTNIESFTGNGINSTLAGDNVQNTWVITAADSGSLGTVAFAGFNNLLGGSDVDNFSLNGGTISGNMDGGAGSDTLTAANGQNTWNITGVDVGDVTGVGSFGHIETLIGNSDSDNFVFANSGSFSGLIDGAGGQDQVDFSSRLGAVTVYLSSSAYTSIETYIGNNADSTLVATNVANTWTISADNGGDINGLAFQGFNNLTGNNSSDSFVISGGTIAGTINGGGGDDTIAADATTNAWTVSGSDAGSVTGVNAFTDIDNLTGGSLVDTFTINGDVSGVVAGGAGDDIVIVGSGIGIAGGINGGSGSDTLYGPNASSTWTITGADAGTVNGITFTSMESLQGGDAADTVTIGSGSSASFSGTIATGAGDDTLDVDFAGAASRNLQYDGGTGTDSLILRGGGSTFDVAYQVGSVPTAGTVTTTGPAATQTVTLANAEAIQDLQQADSLTLTGSSSGDSIQLDTGTVTGTQPVLVKIGGFIPYDFAAKTNVSLDGGAGVDSVDLLGDVTIAGTFSFNNIEALTDSSASTLGADTLSLDKISSVGSATQALDTSINSLAITGGGGSIYLRESDGLGLSAATISGALNIETQTGDITSNGAVSVTGTASFSVGDGGSISLTDSGNSFNNTPSFASTGTIANISLVDNNAVTLFALTLSGNLTVQSGGAISQLGALSIAGTSSFDVGSNGISLDNAQNDFGGAVALQNSGDHAVSITDANGLLLSGATLGRGALTITADSLAQSGPIVQEDAARDITLNVATGSLLLDNSANNFTGRLHLYNAGNGAMTITDGDSLLVGSSTSAGGDINFNAASGVDLNGTVASNDGDISVTTLNNDIQLGRLNAGSGTITLTANNGAIIGNNSPFTDPNLTADSLVITAGTTIGDFNDPIAVMVPSDGTSTFIAGEGSANIIGIAGQILDPSVLVNNVAVTNMAVGMGQNVAVLRPLVSREQTDYMAGYKLFGISNGGILLPYVVGDEEQHRLKGAPRRN